MTEPTRPCGTCGMPCTPGEYHPYAACLMFKACHNSETVRANLEAVRATQAQAGAVPLPKSYQGSTLTSNSHDAGCRVSFSFSSVAEAEAWHESIVDQRHGIKGGQHGTDTK